MSASFCRKSLEAGAKPAFGVTDKPTVVTTVNAICFAVETASVLLPLRLGTFDDR